MWNTQTMALFDPRMMEFVPSHSFSTIPIGNIMRRLDDEMGFVQDRGDLNEREKVILYNPVLLRIIFFLTRLVNKPTILVNG